MLLVIPAAMLLVAGIGIGAHHYIESEEKTDNLVKAKKSVLEVESFLTKKVNANKDWSNLGIKFQNAKIDKDGYFLVNSYKDTYPNVKILLKDFSKNNEQIKIIISSSVGEQYYSELLALNRVGLEKQVPMLFAKNTRIKNPYFSSYGYDQVHKKINCMTNPTMLLAYPLGSTIQNIKFKVPIEACSHVKKNIQMSFEGVSVLNDIKFVNTVYAQKGAEFNDVDIDVLYSATDNIKLTNSNVKKINIVPEYNFPKFQKLMPNILSSQSVLVASKYKKSCEYGERLHIGNGSLNSITIKRGCDAVVLDGSQYNVGSLTVEDGANAQIEFSNNVDFNVKKISMEAFASITLKSLNNGNIILRSENVKVGQCDEMFLGEIARERAGHSQLICSVPGTCLVDTNYLSVASDSFLYSDAVSRTIASIKNSNFNGSLLAQTLVSSDSSFSNIVDNRGNKVINNDFLSVFVGTMKKDSIHSFLGNTKIERCGTIDDCKMAALHIKQNREELAELPEIK
ncbi:MAG TPA: hypothetical protein ENK66_08595 [Arcobacter sp.]|nr:hypothetical protein [Arcobacter sp.]